MLFRWVLHVLVAQAPQRLDHALFLRREFAASEAEAMTTEGGSGAYMSPAELQQEMQQYPAYAN